MATLTYMRDLLGTRLLSAAVFEGLMQAPVTVRTSTQLTLADLDDRINFLGSGFGYLLDGEEILDITAGTIARITLTGNADTVTYLDWSGLNVSAPIFQNYLEAGNWAALSALLFNTADTYSLTDGRDAVRGYGGNDVMHGYNGADRLYGDKGNDKLWGDRGNDPLEGGAGADTLMGGIGIDTLTGAAGADVFAFIVTGTTNRDIITDFDATLDELHFDNDAFGALSYTGQLRRGDFVLGTAATGDSDRFVYQKSTGSLWYDADGVGAGAKVLVAELADGTALTAADIFIL